MSSDKPWLDDPVVRPAVPKDQPAAAPAAEMPPIVSEYGIPEYGQTTPGPAAPADDAVSRVGQAVAQGWRSGTMQTPEARAKNDETLLGHFLINPLIEFGNLPFRAAGALGAGTGQAAYEGGAALGGPALGRDLFMLNQLAPAFAMPGSVHPGLPEAPPGAPPGGRFVSERVAPPRPPGMTNEQRIQQLVEHGVNEEQPPVGPPMARGPMTVELPPPEPPPPVVFPERGGSVGAAQSVNPPEMTPDEFRASRYDGELKRLMQGPVQGDATEHVLGVKPTKAEIELTPSTSREAKGLRQEFREGFNDKEKEDNRIYYDTFDELAGTKTQVQSLERARSAQADKDLKAAGLTTDSERTPVNAQKVVDKIDEILADPRVGESEDVVRYLKPIREQMFDADGKLKDDPLRLYGIREGIVKKLSKASKAETPTVGNVEGQLLDIRDVLDGVIEQGAPGYAQYRKNYSDASKVIDYKERLQDAKTELTNGPDRVFTFGKFDRLMKNLIEERGESGLPQPAHHIPEDVMDKLYGIHRSLQRSASDQELAKTRGSDTTQMLGELGRQGLAQGIAAVVPIPGSHVIAPFVAKHIGGIFTQRRLERHLNPDITNYKNTLGP